VSDGPLVVDHTLTIPTSELTFRATRAGGPGGQHVNTSSTRVELLWNLERSRAVDAAQRDRLREKLSSRLDGDGTLRVVASEFRSQARNRAEAGSRLAALLRKALVVPKARRKTKPTRGAVEQRLHSKRAHSNRKRNRRAPGADD
jgi:ribosome-associated protein